MSAAKLYHERAERTVLRSLMHLPNESFAELAAMEFTAETLYYHHHQILFAEVREMWVEFEKIDLVTVYTRIHRPTVQGGRVVRLSEDFGRNFPLWLANTWDGTAGWWEQDLNEMAKWWPDGKDGEPHVLAHALAAASMVKWLAARRNAIHRAQQLIRDAEDGVAEPDYFNNQL